MLYQYSPDIQQLQDGVGSRYGDGWGRGNRIRDNRKLPMYRASEVVTEPRTWIYPNWLQEGELTVLAGPVGSGKTTFECALAAGISRGSTCSLAPNLTPRGRGYVIIVNREDSIDSLKSRLTAAGADLNRIIFLGCIGGPDKDSTFSFFCERDLNRLETLAESLGHLGLIVINPIYQAVDGDPDDNHKARKAYEGLNKLAKRLKCAILGIAHTVRNPRNKEPLARVAGPRALREVPRAIMLLCKISHGPTESDGTHVLVHAKNNEGTLEGGFEYCHQIEHILGDDGPIETTKLVITAQLTGSAEEILNVAERARPPKPLLKSERAVELLRKVLADGPRPWIELQAMAKEIGISPATLVNAKIALKIVTKKREVDGRSVWRLPDS